MTKARLDESVETGAAAVLKPLITALTGTASAHIRFWDGSALGPVDAPAKIIVRSPDAIRYIVWAPDELGVGRAYVSGSLAIDGDIFNALRAFSTAHVDLHAGMKSLPGGLAALKRLGVLGPPPTPPPSEARPLGWRHTKTRDADAISHHYDVGNDFYRLVLGPSMTYSCAYFADDQTSLEQAQASKHDLVCRKLGMHQRTGMRVLDIGCGWGSMALHAAREYGARVVGITISRKQADLARERVRAAGLDDQIEIRLMDYRDVSDGPFDAISSIGMFEHVGRERMAEYFAVLRTLLAPHGRLLNHAISSVGGSRISKRSFLHRYVFPDGELMDVGDVVLAMEEAGFEVRDVQALREHYALTLRQWVANLQADWDAAAALVGEDRCRIWLLYMAASAIGFEDGGISVHQVLGVVPDRDGGTAFPLTREALTGR
jgi:cyclopropane-fatty-acyl-phospholipid synthase